MVDNKEILVIGGTRYFGIPMIQKLLREGHEVTIATRGMAKDEFGDSIKRLKLNIYEAESVTSALAGKCYDVVIDKMGYGSLDIKSILESVTCKHFIHMSTAGVYKLDHLTIKEEEFHPENEELVWCTRGQYEYDFTKKMAEAAIVQKYSQEKFSIIRSPFVLGENDYTGRLEFYVQHILEKKPMYIDNFEETICVANAMELAEFMADLVNREGVGIVNYCSNDTVSIRQIVEKIEQMTGNKAILSESGDIAPYNGTKTNSLSTEKVKGLGFEISSVHDWIDELLMYYIQQNENGTRRNE